MADLKLNIVLENLNQLKKQIESSISPTISGEKGESGGMGLKGIAMLGGIAAGIFGILSSVQVVQDLLGLVSGLLNYLVAPLVPILITILKPVLVMLNALMGLMFTFFQDPVGMIRKGLEAITGKVAELLGIDPEKFSGWIATIMKFVKDVGDLFKNIFAFLNKLFTGDFVGAFKALLPILKSLWLILKDLFMMAWEGLKVVLMIAWAVMKKVFFGAWRLLFVVLKKSWEALVNFGQWIWDGITVILSKSWELLKDIGQWIWDTMVSVFTTAFDVLKNIGTWIKDKILGVVGGGGGTETKVGDAIIRPDGSVIRTDPRDFLIATKNPGNLGGGSTTININIAGSADQNTVNEVIRRLRFELSRRAV